MSNVVAIIPARGGSKGIDGKNSLIIAGKPLLAWSIERALNSKYIDSVWVTSDSEEILNIAVEYGAHPIIRPAGISGDKASSESAWLHAANTIEQEMSVDIIVGVQATSPVRGENDFDEAIRLFRRDGLDSLISVTEVSDHNVWRLSESGPVPVNHDFNNRKRRQDCDARYLENGSFYLFTPELLRNTNNRIGGVIGFYKQEEYKMYQIDEPEDVRLCEAILSYY